MTIGRSNSVASETRFSVSWNVERAPNSGRNCFGRTSREAGHSRVPAPPHMISGMIRSLICVLLSNLVVVTVPFREPRDPVLDCRRGPESDIAGEILDIRIGRGNIPRLHWQHLFGSSAAE